MAFTDKVVLITGASSGIGRQAALRFSDLGARVALLDIDDQRGWALEQEIDTSGGKAIFLLTDVSVESDVNAAVERVRKVLGPVDILINNAAIYPRQTWTEITFEQWQKVLTTNLTSCFLLCRAVYPDMQERGYGKIINLGSVTTELGLHTDLLHYVTSKSGIIGFTRVLARCVGDDGIRVNCVMPGAIRTEQEIADFRDQEKINEELFDRQALKKRGAPDDIVSAFEFLASPQSDFITGTVLAVDGGWSMY